MSLVSRFRRTVSTVLCAALVLGAPGGSAYQAAAQALGRGAAAESAVRPVVAVPTATGLSAPLTTALPTAFSLSAPAPSLASPALGAAALPSAVPAAAPALSAVPSAAASIAPSAVPAAVPAAALPAAAPAAASVAAESAKTPVSARESAERPSAIGAESAVAAASIRFDGAASRSADDASTPAVSAAAAPATGRRGGALARFARAAVVAATLAVASLSPVHAQTAGGTAAPVQTPVTAPQTPGAVPAAVPAPQAPRPLVAAISVDRSDATVGDRVHLTITLRNPTSKTITVAGLRAALNDALPEDLEISKADSAEAPLILAPGESKTVVYEAIPWASGEIKIAGAVASVEVAEKAAYPDGIEIALPDSKVVVKSVLTPDWKDKGLRDIVDPGSQSSPYWVWLAGGALGLLLLIGAERLVALKRWYPKLDARRLSLVAETETEIARLEREAGALDGAAFAAATQEAVTRFMVDFAGLPRRERSAKTLVRDLKAAKAYRAEAVELAGDIAARAEAARFSRVDEGEDGRRRELARLRALVESVAGKSKAEEPKKPAGLNAFAGGAGLQFGSPWALLLFVPYGVYLWKAWQARRAGARFAVSSEAQASTHRSWRERLAGLPRAARLGAIALIILALARPMIGVQRLESYTPSTDTMIVEDKSGSMDEKMGDGSKLDAAAAAIRAYVDEQRKGTQNRVGMETFDDKPYVDVRLTTDYDALISHLKEIKSGGSTAIGEGILTAVGHFAEVNMMDLDESKDARIAPMKKLLREQGLGAALEYAKAYPDLMDQVLRPDRAKVVVLFTDGESNSGIDPSDAAKIAASLGVKVYTVGVGDSFDAKTLQSVSDITKAQFFKAGDAERMRQVLLEISRLEKSPTKIVSSVAVKDYTALLALVAFILLGAEAALGSTRLRALQAAMILSLSLQTGPISPSLWTAPMAQVTTTAPAGDALAGRKVPDEMVEGNRFYAQGRYDEAVKKYAEAVAAHPELPALYFSMADAYLRLGDVDRAMQSYQRYLDLTKDPAEQSRTLFNMGDAMLRRQDAQKAMEFYKEALRRDPTNQDAKWNLEALKKQQQEQQKDQKQSQQGKGKGKKGQKGQQGQPGNQPGQPGNQKGPPQAGQPGNQQGQPSDASKDPKGDKQKGAEQLTRSIGDQQKKGDEEARKAITRSGSGVWATLALPLAGLAGHGVAVASPLILAAVAVGVPLVALLLWHGLRRGVKSARELSPGTAPKDARSWWGLRRWARKTALALGALALVGLAATDPRGGATDERVNFGGKDMIVAVDGSYSFVYAEDGRMAEAKKELAAFAERLQGTDRIGLVVFAGEGRTASPISIDYGNFEYKVNRLELESRGLKEGSDLGASVKFAAESFDNAKKIGDRARVLIVISDGEAFDSEVDAAIKAAKDHGVTIYAIGMGSPSGTKMKIPTVDGKGTEYLIDSKTGQPAVSHLEEAKLRRLAEATGGAYFRAGNGASIERVMEAVSKREKGRQGDTIKSPRPIGTYLLWPALALLLLDLLLPGASLLRRDASKTGGDEKKKNGSGAGLMGAALIPLAAWPQILPFAIVGTFVAAFLAVDRWKDGALTRGIKEWRQRRAGFVPKGVRSDLGLLFDLREADAPRVDAFVARWQSSGDKERAGLIAAAEADDALWREKLTAAYLSGAGPETHDAVLGALRRASRARLEPLTPVVARAAARAGSLPWLEHADARERMAALLDAASSQPLPFPTPAARRSGRWSRFGRIALTGLLALNMLVSGLSIDGTVRYAREQAAAEQVAFKIFYGDDLFVFSDRYVDERIPEIVLPALRDWHRSPRDAGAELERAIQVLRESPDPKADNVLVAAFRRAPLLPMTATAETTLLKALIERDSDALWASLDKTIAQSADDPAQAALLLKLVVLGAQEGSEHSFMNLFRVLKSPNDEVRGKAFEILYGAMNAPDAKSPFVTRLTAIDAKFASDPTLQIWNEIFALRRLSDAKAAALDPAQVRAFFDQMLKNAQADDAARAPAFAAALAQLQADPNAKPETPASTLATAFSMLDGFEKRAQGADSAVAVPAELAGVARYAVNTQVTALIQEAEKDFPGLHEKLVADGVVLPDTPGSTGSDYDDEEGYYYGGWGRFGHHGSSSGPSSNYREFYKLSHLRTLKADIDAAAKGASFDDAAKAAAATELVDRADASLDAALSAGARAGMMEGGSAAELTAEALLPVLRDGAKAFTGDSFLQILRAKGLAPAIGDASSALAYPEALSPAQLSDLRGLMAAMASTGKVPDGSRALTWAEKQFVARGLDAADAQVDPKAAPAKGFARTGQDGIALARLSAAIDAAGQDGDALVALEAQLIARLEGPAAATADAGDLGQVLPQLIKALDAAGRGGAGWTLLRAAVDAKALPPAALEALRPQAFASLKDLADKLETAFADQGAKQDMLDGDLRFTDSEWRTEFKLRHYDALLAEARKLEAKAKTEDQKKAVAAVEKAVPSMKAFAQKLGVPAGDGAGEVQTVNLNKALHAAWVKFPGQTFVVALRAEGLAVKGDAYDKQKSWLDSYSAADARRLKASLEAKLKAGVWNEGSTTRALTDDEKDLLKAAIARADALIAAQAAAPAPKSLHAFAPLGVLMLSSALGSWAFAAAVAAVATWLILKYAFRETPAALPDADARREAADARRSRVAFLAKRMADSVVGGSFRSRFVGAGGSDFAEARPYQDEDVREIDWKTTAKKGEVYAKKFELEKDMPLMLVIDVSRSGRFGTRGHDKRAVIDDASAMLALAAARANVRVGAILFSDRVEAVIPPRGGLKHAERVVEAIYGAEPAGKGTDLNPALESLGAALKSRAMVAVVSDFLAPDFQDALAGTAARHDLRAIRVIDPAETKPLPDVGLLPLVDAESGATRTLDTGSSRVRREAASAISRREAKIADDLLSARARPIFLTTDGEPLEALAQNFDPKARNAP